MHVTNNFDRDVGARRFRFQQIDDRRRDLVAQFVDRGCLDVKPAQWSAVLEPPDLASGS
jgi:hypothetical protein